MDLKRYNTYTHWNHEAPAALENRFPDSLTSQRNIDAEIE
jgi:hypothetical protein